MSRIIFNLREPKLHKEGILGTIYALPVATLDIIDTSSRIGFNFTLDRMLQESEQDEKNKLLDPADPGQLEEIFVPTVTLYISRKVNIRSKVNRILKIGETPYGVGTSWADELLKMLEEQIALDMLPAWKKAHFYLNEFHLSKNEYGFYDISHAKYGSILTSFDDAMISNNVKRIKNNLAQIVQKN